MKNLICLLFFRDVARQERRWAENLKELQVQQELTRGYRRAEERDSVAAAAAANHGQ